MRTTTFTFRYWDPSETIHHSFNVLVTTPLTDPPFTPKLDVIRIFTSPFTVFPSTAPFFTILTTYLFESFTSIPPRFDSNNEPIHFTFRGVHLDTLLRSDSHRIGDIYRLHALPFESFDRPESRLVTSTDDRSLTITLNDPTHTSDITFSEPIPFNIEHVCAISLCDDNTHSHFLSTPTVVPPLAVINIPNAFTIDGLTNWTLSRTSINQFLLYGCRIVDISGLASWNTSHVTDMSNAFDSLVNLTDITALASWNTSYVTDMSNIFRNCRSLTDLSALALWNTSNLKSIHAAFIACVSLYDVDGLASWDTSHVTDISNAFKSCTMMYDINGLASWNTSHVTDMSFTFGNCMSLMDVSGLAEWDTSNVKNVNGMLIGCYQVMDVSAIMRWRFPMVENEVRNKYKCLDLTDNDVKREVLNVVTYHKRPFRSPLMLRLKRVLGNTVTAT